jgi:hypothetical protein
MQTVPQTNTERAMALVFQFSLGIVPPGTKPETEREQK